MAAPTCPACGAPNAVHVLPFPSELSCVDYYRCECGHAWNIDKADRTQINHVTPLPTKPALCRALSDYDLVPLPFNCPKCREPMQFHYARTGEDQLEPYRILIYLCAQHGFFRYSRHHVMAEGL